MLRLRTVGEATWNLCPIFTKDASSLAGWPLLALGLGNVRARISLRDTNNHELTYAKSEPFWVHSGPQLRLIPLNAVSLVCPASPWRHTDYCAGEATVQLELNQPYILRDHIGDGPSLYLPCVYHLRPSRYVGKFALKLTIKRYAVNLPDDSIVIFEEDHNSFKSLVKTILPDTPALPAEATFATFNWHWFRVDLHNMGVIPPAFPVDPAGPFGGLVAEVVVYQMTSLVVKMNPWSRHNLTYVPNTLIPIWIEFSDCPRYNTAPGGPCYDLLGLPWKMEAIDRDDRRYDLNAMRMPDNWWHSSSSSSLGVDVAVSLPSTLRPEANPFYINVQWTPVTGHRWNDRSSTFDISEPAGPVISCQSRADFATAQGALRLPTDGTTSCTWSLTIPYQSPQSLWVTFPEVDLDAGDELMIYDGPTADPNSLLRIIGSATDRVTSIESLLSRTRALTMSLRRGARTNSSWKLAVTWLVMPTPATITVTDLPHAVAPGDHLAISWNTTINQACESFIKFAKSPKLLGVIQHHESFRDLMICEGVGEFWAHLGAVMGVGRASPTRDHLTESFELFKPRVFSLPFMMGALWRQDMDLSAAKAVSTMFIDLIMWDVHAFRSADFPNFCPVFQVFRICRLFGVYASRLWANRCPNMLLFCSMIAGNLRATNPSISSVAYFVSRTFGELVDFADPSRLAGLSRDLGNGKLPLTFRNDAPSVPSGRVAKVVPTRMDLGQVFNYGKLHGLAANSRIFPFPYGEIGSLLPNLTRLWAVAQNVTADPMALGSVTGAGPFLWVTQNNTQGSYKILVETVVPGWPAVFSWSNQFTIAPVVPAAGAAAIWPWILLGSLLGAGALAVPLGIGSWLWLRRRRASRLASDNRQVLLASVDNL
ncbi:hypothetical protein PAPYR_8273 [Paratrimastix pyriformis]|uniref:Uncharacterized protein n=1 Tax=Paratrimastix pyriformis TaxID=342808 RepID=A0ABQ8UEC6_9EUKA|nr:hypothetical protein PAPYR_8273 [Paratrimastix pyriformis]